MNNFSFLYLSCILAGFSLIKVPLSGFLKPLAPLADLVGILAVLLFSSVIIFNGILFLFGKRRI